MKNEKGAALLTAVMLLVILTIIGLAGVNTTLFEENISHNEAAYRQGFYKADGGISVAREITSMGGANIPGAGTIPARLRAHPSHYRDFGQLVPDARTLPC